MIPEETRSFLSIPKRHPLVFVVVYSPVIASVVVSSMLYRFTFAYIFIMLWCLFVSLFVIDGINQGRLTDNHGTAIRRQTPVRFWAKISIWSVFYILAIGLCIGFALQERAKQRGNKPAALNPAMTSQLGK